jgi:hypothetical protein
LALVPAIHPLPWWHLFVFTYPVAVLAIDRSFRSTRKDERKKLAARALACIGIFLIGAATQRFMGVFGMELTGNFLERTAGKSIGVLCCMGSLLLLAPGYGPVRKRAKRI